MAFGNSGTSWYLYSFFDGNSIADSAWVVIQFMATSTAGIDDMRSVKFKVYPNPSSDIFILSFPGNKIKGISTEVYNTTGYLILEFSSSEDLSKTSIDLSGNPPGVYLIRAKGSDFDFSSKALKTN